MADSPASVVFSPETIAKRQSVAWRGIAAEIVQLTRHEPFKYRLRAPVHTLMALYRAERRAGETVVEGLPPSTRREFSKKLTLVPAGREFRGWQDPRVLTRVACFYIDPSGPLLDPCWRFGELDPTPRLFFDDPALWETAAKLTAEIERGAETDPLYAESLGAVLLAEIIRLDRGTPPRGANLRGGLAAWQRRAVEHHIEAHLAEPLALAALADLVRLSPQHFVRAFKQSFGQPPHHYHLARRIEEAKALLAKPELSVTEIALALGFANTSAFSTTFRKRTGAPPRDYRRRLA
ncbi:MAG TPA: helix-turn-helix transcriptional regulator [Stellaceae bacterium]|nr:helix-turn-helix transcriptional regulator [Stellaceae bacterium]